jgi:hypothetical protein
MGIVLRLRNEFRRLAAPAFFLLLGTMQIPAQEVSEYQVKAAYLYNFSKFIEWPAADFANATSPFQFCVLHDRSFAEQLAQTVKGKMVASRPASVISVKNAEEGRSCHILFISSSQNIEAQVIETLRNTNVLTVGEVKGFVEEGGMINFVIQDDRVQFQVNHRAARQAGLRVSSRLLSVAKLVVE